MTTGQKFSILSDTRCRLGEGPSYDPGTDTLYWFDILERKLLERHLSSGNERSHDLPGMGSAIASVDGDRQMVVTEHGAYLRDRRSGSLSMHRDIEGDNPATRSNDARVHPAGAFWIGTMGKDAQPGAGKLYWLCRGELRVLFDGMTIPNGICFAPDGSTAYFTGLIEGVFHRVGCDPDTGLPIGEPAVFHDHRGLPGAIDGAVADRDGIVWNACWGASSVNAYAPDGRLLGTYPVGASRATCPAFVGVDADRLAVTSAWEGLTDDERKVSQTDAGKTFSLGVPVKGRFEPSVLV